MLFVLRIRLEVTLEPVHDSQGVIIYHGDNLAVMRSMASDSVDSIVTDPPYGLSFMGKKWDYDVPSVEHGWIATCNLNHAPRCSILEPSPAIWWAPGRQTGCIYALHRHK